MNDKSIIILSYRPLTGEPIRICACNNKEAVDKMIDLCMQQYPDVYSNISRFETMQLMYYEVN